MEAGRELDVRIAELLGVVMTDGEYVAAGVRATERSIYRGRDGVTRTHPDHYSTDIAAAFMMVEHMHSMGYHLVLFFDDISGPSPHWNARFPKFLTGCEQRTTADWAPLAICMAALATLDK